MASFDIAGLLARPAAMQARVASLEAAMPRKDRFIIYQQNPSTA